MSQATANPTGDVPAMRVIVVGRTGYEGVLRMNPSVELVRVRTGLDAVGEIASPLNGVPPARTTVIVGPKADLASAAPEALDDFFEAVRTTDPSVMLVRAFGDMANASEDGFDASLGVDADADELVRVLEGHQHTDDETPEPASEHEPSAKPEPASEEIAPVSSDDPPEPSGLGTGAFESFLNVGGTAEHDAVSGGWDAPLVACLMQGQRVDDVAVELLRQRLSDRSICFIADESHSDEDDSHDGAPSAALSVPVVYAGERLGTLSSDIPGADLGASASWIAGWLALAEQHRRLRVDAFSDPVTGAWNRRYFDRFLPDAMEHARLNRYRLTLLVFDLDNFKSYNDSYGHDAGDLILRETVQLLKSVIRPTDRVCRIGGDEFAVVFYEPEGPRNPNTEHPTSFMDVAERFQRQIEQQRFPKLGIEAPGTLTISGGLATYPWDGATPEALIVRADQLAMKSKRQGKNALTLGPGAMRARDDAGRIRKTRDE